MMAWRKTEGANNSCNIYPEMGSPPGIFGGFFLRGGVSYPVMTFLDVGVCLLFQ